MPFSFIFLSSFCVLFSVGNSAMYKETDHRQNPVSAYMTMSVVPLCSLLLLYCFFIFLLLHHISIPVQSVTASVTSIVAVVVVVGTVSFVAIVL